MKIELTETGKDLLTESLTGEIGITFSSIVIGNGDGSQATSSISTLVNPLRTLAITECEKHENFAEISASLTNAAVEDQINITEIGVMALDPGLNDTPVLFAYLYTPEESAIIIPSANDYVLETIMKVDVYVSSAENISAIINESLAYPTKAEFNEHVNDRTNPHKVTKEQVGLGNVENKAINDQTPTFDLPNESDYIFPGETIKVILGKVRRAIIDLIRHIGNKNNPHGVTPAQIGASSTGHKHSASDVNAGTLGVTRGGTGLGSISSGSLLYASDQNVISQLYRSFVNGSILRQDGSGKPYWGPVCVTGTYKGNDRVGQGNTTSLSFSNGFNPKIIVIVSLSLPRSFGVILDTVGFCDWDGSGPYNLFVSRSTSDSTTTVSWYQTKSTNSAAQLNAGTFTYHYVAIG